ncbi:SseB family protein [Alphaproteobacteria bacterium GH1-50]|uniref:SseB family protein n=1 Tax=Kangsaoukella pontilimi TaxID=2691042 RepID=A0A7C9MI75_9RHOB|nr:SseB family protein [Kangsaoukella pontilimi]MXQ09536.1 SseB family protein [Kangsaoukella pontilimi]
MTQDTPLDIAHASMEAEDSDAARLRFYDRLAESELFLLLDGEAQGDTVDPRVFDTEDGRFVLAFDREHRLTDFTGDIAPYAALSGRALAGLLAAEGLGLGLNLGVAPSSILIPPDAMAWLATTLADGPGEVEARPVEVAPPGGVPEALVLSLDTKLATAQGLARFAYLATARYEDGAEGHILAFIDPVPGAEPALSRAAHEALIFSGVEAGEMDVGFFRASDPMAAHLARVALRFDIPEAPASEGPSAPGMDPDAPPRLR